MHKPIILTLLLALLFSCRADDDMVFPACGVDNPVRELAWLKAEISKRETNPTEEMKYCYIYQADFEGETVFVYEDCNPLIDKIIPIHDCEGTVINTGANPVSFDDLKRKAIIWRPDNLVCDISF